MRRTIRIAVFLAITAFSLGYCFGHRTEAQDGWIEILQTRSGIILSTLRGDRVINAEGNPILTVRMTAQEVDFHWIVKYEFKCKQRMIRLASYGSSLDDLKPNPDAATKEWYGVVKTSASEVLLEMACKEEHQWQ